MKRRASAAIGFILALLAFAAVGAQLATQRSSAQGVTVAVTPLRLDDEVWEFRIALDTHSQELSDDVARSAVLLQSSGREQRPLGWDGAAPGGHHRVGVLKFGAILPRPQWIELRISRPGEPQARSFRWKLE